MRTSLVRSSRSLSLAVALALSVAPLACKPDAQLPVGICSATYTPAVSVSITDSMTARALADSARGVAQAGTYLDSLHRVNSPPDVMVGGAVSGSYEVRFEHDGYAPWTRSGIGVTRSTVGCGGLNTVSLTAKLQPVP